MKSLERNHLQVANCNKKDKQHMAKLLRIRFCEIEDFISARNMRVVVEGKNSYVKRH